MQPDIPPLANDAATLAAKARKLRALMFETGLTFQELAAAVQLSEQDLINLLSAGQTQVRELTQSESENSVSDDASRPQESDPA
jgi:hypothetical protein